MGKVILVVALLALAVYGLMWLLERRRVGLPFKGTKRPPTTAPKAPDDDEDFLRELDRKRRHQQDGES